MSHITGQARSCRLHAIEWQVRARRSCDEDIRQECSQIAEQWLELARCYGRVERLSACLEWQANRITLATAHESGTFGALALAQR